MSGPVSWRSRSDRTADLDLIPCLLLVLAAVAWTITGRGEGTTRSVTAPQLAVRQVDVGPTGRAQRAGSAGQAREMPYHRATAAPPQGGLIP